MNTARLSAHGLMTMLSAIVWLISSLSFAQERARTGTVYVIHAVDTEARGTSPTVYSQSDNFSDYELNGEVGRAMADSSRDVFVDSDGSRVKFTWFGLTQEAYHFSTSRSATVVFGELERLAAEIKRSGDEVGWHYHHADWSNPSDTTDGAGCWKQCLTFNGASSMHGSDIELAEQMVAMLILDRGYYPSVFRAGWTWESADFSVWLDDVVPFDFSNNAPLVSTAAQSTRDTSGGVYDWFQAPSDWSYYHPDSSDYQKAGKLKRIIFRCFPGHKASDLGFHKAFVKARTGEDVLVGAYVHSFEDLAKFCRITTSALKSTAQMFPGVRYKFVTAREGAQLVLGLEHERPPQVRMERAGEQVMLISDKPLFCYPYGAIRDSGGYYRRVRPTSGDPDTTRGDYRWTFDLTNKDYTEFAAGCVDIAGNSVVTEKYGR